MKPPGIYPSKLPIEIINDPKRNAEVQVYDALKDLSENGFHVFYSCFWLDNRETGPQEMVRRTSLLTQTTAFSPLRSKGVIVRDGEMVV